jgi:hypothetical protein
MKRIMFLLLIMINFFIFSGCSTQIEQPELGKIINSCKDHEGVYKISVYPYRATKIYVKCNDGVIIDNKQIK